MPDKRVQVIVCVEGPTDILFLKSIGRMLRSSDSTFPDLDGDPRIAMLPLGGSTLKEWVAQNYLKNLGVHEVHFYDRDLEQPPKYQATCDSVNEREGNHFATLTKKREIENYLHNEAILEAIGVTVNFGDLDDVSSLVAEQLHIADVAAKPWTQVGESDKKKKASSAKKRLNRDCAAKMTLARLSESDPDDEIRSWLKEIAKRLV